MTLGGSPRQLRARALRTFARDGVQRRNGLEVKDELIPIGDAVLARIQHEAIEAQKLMVGSPNHTVVYIPVGPMGVPVTGSFNATAPEVVQRSVRLTGRRW